MFWIEIEDLAGWLCKTYDSKGITPLYTVIYKRGSGLDKWMGYGPFLSEDVSVTKFDLHHNIEGEFYNFVMGHEFERKELTPMRKVVDLDKDTNKKLSWKIMSDEYYDFEELLRKKNIHFKTKDGVITIDHEGYVYLNSLTHLPDNVIFNNKGFVNLDSLTQLPDNVQFNNKGDVYLYSLTQLPDNVQFNNKGDVYLYSLTQLPDNKEQIFRNDGIVYYNGRRQKYDTRTNKVSKLSKLFIYIKPDEDIPLSIEEAHTTIAYLNNSVEGEDRKRVISDISNILKNYSPPKCSWEGVATFDNEDKSRVILINFENGAEIYTDIIEVLSKYIDVDRDYNFIPHMTINKDLEISQLPEYEWEPKSIFIEFEKNIPAIEIEFKTGKIKESQNLQETVGVEESKKLSWKEPDNYDGWLVRVEESTRKKVFWEYAVISRIAEDGLYVYFGENEEEAIKDTFDQNKFPFYVKKEEFDFIPIRQVKSYKSSSNAFNVYKDKNSEMYKKRLMFYNENDGPEIFWSSKTAQEKRFEALLDIGDLSDKEILDVGCGYADFLTYIKNKGININKYVGVDIVEDIVEKAKEMHPNINISVRDIQKDPVEEDSFDYVFGSGIFAIDDANWNHYVVDMLRKMLSSSRIGVGVNFLKQQSMNRLSWGESKFPKEYKGKLVKVIEEKDCPSHEVRKLSWKIMSDVYYDFEELLRNNGIHFKTKDGIITIDHNGNVYLDSLTQLPDNVIFNNKGHVYLDSLTQLPDNVQFNNKGDVYLDLITQLPDNVQFNNKGYVNLYSLTQLPDNVQFNNNGFVYLDSLTQLPDNKEQIFRNDGIVYYDKVNQKYDPRTRKLSCQSGKDSYKESSLNQLKHNDPQTIINFIKQNVTDKVTLKDNYLDDDFTVFLYKS